MGQAAPDKRERHEQLALAKPMLTVLSDQALLPEEAHLDSFQLSHRLGPVYDILRHPDTRTPMAIAIYGDWGAGKTTAMRWLHGLLETWNDKGDGRVKVRPVWFYPWKYHDREDVWRGLVAEVILASINVPRAGPKRIARAMSRFGGFLGRSFLHALTAPKLKAGVEIDLNALKEKILAEHVGIAHPEKGYLNQFEESLQHWVRQTIGRRGQRMVLFIDDLDRCMPEVALQVLEALKLYLSIENLIFVVGVDRTVIDDLVRGHYEQLGLKPEKSHYYLAKMFQVEVELGVSELEIEDFLDEQLKRVALWEQRLSEEERGIFRRVILNFAGRNPREVKRLINSAVMAGAGTLIREGAS